jgi:hypothetical protein
MGRFSAISKMSIIFLAFIIYGCATTTKANFYPVQGPLSKQNPIPIIIADVDGITSNTGNITLTLPDGEKCVGKWSSAAGVVSGYSTVNLFSKYGYVFGTGTSVSNVPGVNRGEAVLVGNKGAVMEIEFYTGSGTANGWGIAKDNRENIFKVIF